ncbi:ComF family protein [Bacillus sp. PS06]|uniref:ComF family protein n=1 Tax=Bacillus sp. PS06 TaxID=2764176 RepID=UPI00178277A3|nr:ComF family protein [Bacillus sp. PS06]MBD8071391.1 ComF family protein [Bacillus sp. PS06]
MTKCLICFEPFTDERWGTLFLIGEPNNICSQCRESFERIEGTICQTCGRPLDDLAKEYIHGDQCYDCVRWLEDPKWVHTLTSNRSVYRYNDWLKQVLSQYKFRGDHKLATVFKKDFIKAYKSNFSSSFILVPIPLSQERLYERGFNQAQIFAEFLGKPQELLTRVHHEKQSKKSREHRIHAENVFSLKEGNDLKGTHILLIDDIYTTGSTLRHAAEVLLTANATSVSSLTLVRS